MYVHTSFLLRAIECGRARRWIRDKQRWLAWVEGPWLPLLCCCGLSPSHLLRQPVGIVGCQLVERPLDRRLLLLFHRIEWGRHGNDLEAQTCRCHVLLRYISIHRERACWGWLETITHCLEGIRLELSLKLDNKVLHKDCQVCFSDSTTYSESRSGHLGYDSKETAAQHGNCTAWHGCRKLHQNDPYCVVRFKASCTF